MRFILCSLLSGALALHVLNMLHVPQTVWQHLPCTRCWAQELSAKRGTRLGERVVGRGWGWGGGGVEQSFCQKDV